MRRIKVGYFVSNLKNYSGASFQALSLAKSIDRQKFEIIFFNKNKTGNRFSIEEFDGFTVVDLSASIILRLLQIVFYALLYKINIFHVHGFFKDALISSVLLRKKVVLKTTLLGEDDFHSLVQRRFGFLNRWLLMKVDINIALSQALLDINSKIIPRDRIKVIPNGVMVPDKASHSCNNKTFCTVGIIHPRKRTYEVIKYFCEFLSEDVDAKLYVVGPDVNSDRLTEFDSAYISKCKQLPFELGKEKHVEFTGKLSRDEVNMVYAKSFGFIFFSEKEGMPNVLLEAMAYNCVPIISEIGGVAREIVEDKEDGVVVSSFKDLIDFSLLETISKTHRPFLKVKSVFDIFAVGKQYMIVYSWLGSLDSSSL